jgi:flagellar protein FlaG
MPIDFNMPVSVTLARLDNVRVLAPVPDSKKILPKEVEGAGRERQELSGGVHDLPQEGDAADQEQLQQAVREINSVVQNLQRDLQFKVDTESGMTVISVIDSETKEVIRQLPPEDVLKRAKRMDEAAKGEFPVDGLLLEMKI